MASKSKSEPTQKEIVVALMQFQGKEQRRVENKTTGRAVIKTYLQYRCPKPTCVSPVQVFSDKSGYGNPYTHLRTCYGKGMTVAEQRKVLRDLYEEAREASRAKGGSILSHFKTKSLSEYDKTVHGYIRFIVMKSLPVYYISDFEVRRFSRFQATVGKENFVEILFKLVELVEKRICNEMNGTKGAVLFDGWTCNSTHYVSIIASYCTESVSRSSNEAKVVSTPRLTLLALSPMGPVSEDDCEDQDTDETTTFNAESHAQFFEEIFPIFGQDFSSWCVCLIGDNCSTNKKVAALTKKKYVGCYSHKLNLEVNQMVNDHVQLRRTIESVHKTMKGAKKLKNAALLRNLTDLSPIMHNSTRWSGKLHMLRRFLRIRDDLIEVHTASEGDLFVDTNPALATRAQRFCRMLAEIDIVTKSLQQRGHTLSQCRDDLDVLMEAVEEEQQQVTSALYQCKLGKKYISPTASIVLHPIFESGVVKLQKGLYEELTPDEKQAVECLLKEDENLEGQGSTERSESASSMSMVERLAKRRKISVKKQKYMDCDFILGSVAEVERLWSIAKYVLTDNRKSMTPRMFEALVFLKLNERFWDDRLVSEAIHGARSDRVAARLEQLASEEGMLFG